MYFIDKNFFYFLGSILKFFVGKANKNDLIQATSQLADIQKKILQYLLYFSLLIVSIYILHKNPKYVPESILQYLEKLTSIWTEIESITEFFSIFLENKFFILLFIITLAITYLIKQTNKDEKRLFSSSKYILFPKYLNDIEKLICHPNNPAEIIEATRAKKENKPFDINFFDKKIYTKSIYLIEPSILSSNNIDKISNLEFRHNGQSYSPPPLISSIAKEKLVEKFNHQSNNKSNYNGVTLRVKNVLIENNKIILEMETSFFFYYLITNMIADIEIFYNTTVRDILEPGQPSYKLNNLNITQAENHLGLNCLLIDEHKNILIGIRNHKVSAFKGQLSPSVSGAANLVTCSSKDGNLSPLFWLEHEMNEEIFSNSNNAEIKKFISSLSSKAIFLGLSRELMRLGKPEAFFAIKLSNIEKEELKHYMFNSNEKSPDQSIDQNENESFSWINLDNIIKNNQYKHDNKNDHYTITIPTYGEHRFVLSESLLVNMLLYAKKYM